MKKIHFMGIGGSGASACAAIAITQGFEVTGCDQNSDNEFTQHFDKSQILNGHNPMHLQGVEILVITPAITSIDSENLELQEAKKRNIKIMTWQKFLGKFLTKGKFVIAVCGTHGKSTTTAMTGKLLEDGGLDPTVLLGAIIPSWKTNFRVGKSKYFVVEADEFNDNFLNITPDITVLTNIEMDHPEYFKDETAYKRSFQNFLHKTKVKIIANLKDRGAGETLLEEAASNGMFFKPIVDYSKMLIDFPLKVFGGYNILNASAVYQVGLSIGISETSIRKSLMAFEGIARRFEFLGKLNGAKIYSDFAHHPTEIEKTLKAARQKFPDNKIWVIFEPHMFSRTKAFFDDFVKVFQNAPVDQIYILDIYASRDTDTKNVTSKQLVEAIRKSNIQYVVAILDLLEVLAKILKDGDVLIFMGAGDIDKIAKEFIKKYGTE